MKLGTSLYLDVARITAALVVFGEHLKEHTRNSFHWFWVLHPGWYSWSDPMSLVAGMAVFVLSGYVIAHVLATRERTPHAFAASRIARLYSLAIPALILAAVTNYAESVRYPAAFVHYDNVPMVLRYLTTAAFLNGYWLWPDLSPPNLPYWRLSYEVMFYIGIGLVMFTQSWRRILSLLVLSAVAGPTAILLAPTWCAGFAAYHLGKHVQLRSMHLATTLLGLSILCLCFGPLVEVSFREHIAWLRMPDNTVGGLAASYVEAISFAVSIVAIEAIVPQKLAVPKWLVSATRWLSGTTFALYMLHQQLLSLFVVYPIGQTAADRSSLAQGALLVFGTLAVVGTIGHYCEKLKLPYRRWLIGGLNPHPAQLVV